VDPFDLLKVVADLCDLLGIRYVTVGSLAGIAYGEPRFTNDIDVVIDLSAPLISEFCNFFPGSDYYLSRSEVEIAVRDRRQFNIIHTKTSLKVDCILPASAFDRAELMRGARKRVRNDFEAVFAAPEDVILKKLEYYKLGESENHLRDIAGVLKVSGDQLDMAYIEHTATQLGVTEVWQLVVARLKQP
jgi:hypothetical protein